MAVCHYTISILDEYHDWATDYAQQLQTARTELERGIFNVTSKVNSLVTLGLVIHVPISVYVCLYPQHNCHFTEVFRAMNPTNTDKTSLELHTWRYL
jgi:hypothetical protein